MSALDQICQEYERCLRPSPEMLKANLYGLESKDEVPRYYEYRAEALGFALDRLERGKA